MLYRISTAKNLLVSLNARLSTRTKVFAGVASVALIAGIFCATIATQSAEAQARAVVSQNTQVKHVTKPAVVPAATSGSDAAAKVETPPTVNTAVGDTPKPASSAQPTKSVQQVSAPKNPAPAPSPAPTCPECGGDPDKIPSHVGVLILSASTVTVAQGQFNYDLLTARSDSGEAIATAYVVYGAGSPMIMTSTSSAWGYASQQTFGFNVNNNVAPGTYNLKLVASSENKGQYYGYVTVIVTP